MNALSKLLCRAGAFSALACLLLLTACGGGGASNSSTAQASLPAAGADPCSTEGMKAFVYQTASRYYLWSQLIPTSVQPNHYQTPDALLEAMIARARSSNLDRGYTRLVSMQEEIKSLREGSQVDPGFRTKPSKDGLFVSDVVSEPLASLLSRGDRIIAFADRPENLDKPENQTTFIQATGKTPGFLATLAAGSVFYLRVLKEGASIPADVPVPYGEVTMDPVPIHYTFPAGGRTIGYIYMRIFIETAEAKLRTIMGEFLRAGVKDVIVDLRYNPGGLTSTMGVFANLLSPVPPGSLMFEQRYGPASGLPAKKTFFGPDASALSPTRVAFITTNRSASASEGLITILQTGFGKNLAVVGSTTYGKNVGMTFFQNGSCDSALVLVNMELVNSKGNGGYSNGLPDDKFEGVSIRAEDDLRVPLGDPADDSIAKAIGWIVSGKDPGNPISPSPAGVAQSKAPSSPLSPLEPPVGLFDLSR